MPMSQRHRAKVRELGAAANIAAPTRDYYAAAGASHADDEDENDLRILRWDEYARSRGVPMFGTPGEQPGVLGYLPGVYCDLYAWPPHEGVLGHSAGEQALFELLSRHTPAGEDATCTALLGLHLGLGPEPTDVDGGSFFDHVQRGPLATAHLELYEECDFASPPFNLWPDDRTWVLETDLDSWITAVSGPVALVEDILASSDLEALRLRHRP